MEKDLNLSKGETEKLEKEVLEMNNIIKELSLHHERGKKNLQRCLENWKKELQETHERTAAETKKQVQEITTFQKENQELRSEIKQETHKISKLNTQVARKKGALKKSHEGLEAKRKNGKKVKGKLEAVHKGKQKDKSCSHCEKLKEELNLIKTEKENLEVGKLNNSVKDKSKDYQRDIQTLQKELQSLKEGCENFLRELEVAANEQRQEGKKVLQGKNEELKDQIKKQTSEAHENTVQPMREKTDIKKVQEEGQRHKWVLNYTGGSEKRGVVYAFATNFGKKPWVNGSSTRIIATRSSDYRGKAEDLLEKGSGAVSGTGDEENSWWRVDLTASYVLNLRHYTLMRNWNDRESYILNWRLEGSLDGYCWKILKEHENDNGLKAHPYSRTWLVDGEVGAFRYFRIFQTGENSLGKFNIFLSGIELYGVLIEMGS